MKAAEIRQAQREYARQNDVLSNGDPNLIVQMSQVATLDFVAEIAAQLAELNENLRLVFQMDERGRDPRLNVNKLE